MKKLFLFLTIIFFNSFWVMGADSADTTFLISDTQILFDDWNDTVCLISPDQRFWPNVGNRALPWILNVNDLYRAQREPRNPVVHRAARQSLFLIGRIKNGKYRVLIPMLTLANDTSLAFSYFETTPAGKLIVKTTPSGHSIPKVVVSESFSPYRAVYHAMYYVHSLHPDSRFIKPYRTPPAPFYDFIGWCSWEHFKKNISEKKLVDITRKIIESPVPIRWILIDDGFQKEKDLKLKSFTPRLDRFPTQFRALTSLKGSKIRWMGIWHCYYGLWNGIHPQNDFSEMINDGLVRDNGVLWPAQNSTASEIFYAEFMKSVKDRGFDFVKIDVQAELLKRSNVTVSMNVNNSYALEKICDSVGLPIMNCMAMGPVTSYCTLFSNMMRCSMDYKLGDLPMAKIHLWQSYQNALWLSAFSIPDHDMFHSSDPICGEIMALSKLIGGSPIYLSDVPEKFDLSIIMPLCDSSGKIDHPFPPRILNTLNSKYCAMPTALPSPESILLDPINTPNCYRVMSNMQGLLGIVLYNLTHINGGSVPVTGALSLDDYVTASKIFELLPYHEGDPLLAYNWRKHAGCVLTDSRSLTLSSFGDDFWLLSPIHSDWGILGRSDKYMSRAYLSDIHFKDTALSFSMKEFGPVVFWSDPHLPPPMASYPIVDLGNGFYELKVSSQIKGSRLTIRRPKKM